MSERPRVTIMPMVSAILRHRALPPPDLTIRSWRADRVHGLRECFRRHAARTGSFFGDVHDRSALVARHAVDTDVETAGRLLSHRGNDGHLTGEVQLDNVRRRLFGA